MSKRINKFASKDLHFQVAMLIGRQKGNVEQGKYFLQVRFCLKRTLVRYLGFNLMLVLFKHICHVITIEYPFIVVVSVLVVGFVTADAVFVVNT